MMMSLTFVILAVLGSRIGGDAIDFFEIFNPNHCCIRTYLFCQWPINWFKH